MKTSTFLDTLIDKELMYVKKAKITMPEREGIGKREEKVSEDPDLTVTARK